MDSAVDSFLSKPTEKNVHDMRTTMRRIEAYTDLLPKSLRKKQKFALYLSQAKLLFKATTPIRDIDIIRLNLGKLVSSHDVLGFLEDQKQNREKMLPVAVKLASTLKKIAVPKIKPSQLSQSKLLKRKKKVVRRYQDSITQRIKTVDNPTVEQLHELRKDCKMLRYSLEIDAKENQKLSSELVKIQGLLGLVMDDYTTLNSLAALDQEAIKPVVVALKLEKEKAYNDFLRISKSFFSDTDDSEQS